MSELAKKYNVSDQQLDEMISDEHINAVSLFLPKWEAVANQLGVNELTIAGIKATPGIDIVNINHRVLTAWKDAQYKQATYRRLVDTLDKLDCKRHADKVCKLISGATATEPNYAATAAIDPQGVSRQSATAEVLVRAKQIPKLQELMDFPGRNGSIDIPQQISTKYNAFGVHLLEDDTGAKVAAIALKFHDDPYQISCAILRQWLEGEGMEPVTWETLTTVLRKIKLRTLAEEIEEVLKRQS